MSWCFIVHGNWIGFLNQDESCYITGSRYLLDINKAKLCSLGINIYVIKKWCLSLINKMRPETLPNSKIYSMRWILLLKQKTGDVQLYLRLLITIWLKQKYLIVVTTCLSTRDSHVLINLLSSYVIVKNTWQTYPWQRFLNSKVISSWFGPIQPRNGYCEHPLTDTGDLLLLA